MGPSGLWLTTARLGLRRFSPHDFGWLTSLYSDADVTRFIGGIKTGEQVQELLEARVLQYYDRHPGLGIWITVDRASGDALGFHLLNHIQGESIVQVGFVLLKSAWGRGVATEMGSALLRYGFEELNLPRICGMANLPNLASQRVLSKIGLRRDGERQFPHPVYSAQGAMAWFERDRSDWLAENVT
jgi:[ribosomal protein S5]-alanine N-acetyltransferase